MILWFQITVLMALVMSWASGAVITSDKRLENTETAVVDSSHLSNSTKFGQESIGTSRGRGATRTRVSSEHRTEANAEDDIIWPALANGVSPNFNDISYTIGRHLRIGAITLVCGNRLDSMYIAWRNFIPAPGLTPDWDQVTHGGQGGKDPKAGYMLIDDNQYINKVVIHSTFHDKQHPPQVSYVELHIARESDSRDRGGSHTVGSAPYSCGVPSRYPGNIWFPRQDVSLLMQIEDQHTFVKDGHAVLSFFGSANKEIEALGVTWIPVSDY